MQRRQAAPRRRGTPLERAQSAIRSAKLHTHKLDCPASLALPFTGQAAYAAAFYCRAFSQRERNRRAACRLSRLPRDLGESHLFAPWRRRMAAFKIGSFNLIPAFIVTTVWCVHWEHAAGCCAAACQAAATRSRCCTPANRGAPRLSPPPCLRRAALRASARCRTAPSGCSTARCGFACARLLRARQRL